ncbi:hypothetical protein CYLTODRAFT_231166 [Cylindrobasidium torrendii FP15055 ss-10]|uniref:VRR-NUC domain-containing protein n=1 Tax=Cylindrobasidium torrendii FP15055 ss-10 TaxID=1314674 RepID=A0A0D7BGR5_9AGAR|nr:hypothetical protein CYLTODRAFT_231166 [Cylindrobasidium torrendii FP15055 ss-10]
MALRGKDFRPRLASITDGSIANVLNDDEFWNPLLSLVGVDYVNNTEEDVRHLIRYMDKQALAGACKLLAEDYLHRLEGIPEVIAFRKDGTKTAFAVIAKDGLEAQQKMWLEALQMAPGAKLRTQEEVKAYRMNMQTTVLSITSKKPKQSKKRKDSADYTSGDDNDDAPLSPPAKRTRRSTKISESN